jgi:phosphoribosylformylglycinamidine synthase subunit PurS
LNVVRDPAAPTGPARHLEVRVELKPGVVDAEAQSIREALSRLGLSAVTGVAVARVYRLEFSGVDEHEARRLADEAVDRLLANPVIHRVTIRPGAD